MIASNVVFKHKRNEFFIFIPTSFSPDEISGDIGVNKNITIPSDYFFQEWSETDVDKEKFLQKAASFPDNTHYAIVNYLCFDTSNFPMGYIYFNIGENIPAWKFKIFNNYDEALDHLSPLNVLLKIKNLNNHNIQSINNDLKTLNLIRFKKIPFIGSETSIQSFEFSLLCYLEEKYK